MKDRYVILFGIGDIQSINELSDELLIQFLNDGDIEIVDTQEGKYLDYESTGSKDNQVWKEIDEYVYVEEEISDVEYEETGGTTHEGEETHEELSDRDIANQ